MPQIRAHVRIYGEVQGVFFRGTARGLALANDVRGWIRNRADGSVEGEFEGEEDAVRDLVAWCHDGPRGADVESVDVTWTDATGQEQGFSVL
ncbi:MAG: acylphosphatase [Chloroflexota bacterium]